MPRRKKTAPTPFIHDDFLLETDEARRLYHTYAAPLPIIDYHCHLPPRQIAADQRYRSITDVWLGGDHYKWRAMRANGVPERLVTGEGGDWEKFEQWAGTMPRLLRSPLYDWAHLELARYFGVTDRLLGPDTARDIWEVCNARLAQPDFSARGLMIRSNVVLVCTTDDPTDALEHHRALAADNAFPVQVLPTWRPDKGMAVEDPAAFNAWVDKLALAAGTTIADFDAFLDALRKRQEAFQQAGCRLSDHGIETVYAADYTAAEIRDAFAQVRGGAPLAPETVLKFKSAMLVEFGVMDAEKDWTQQYHLGALRNVNSRPYAALGPDTGYDAIGDFEVARPLARLLDRLARRGRLPRTILYNLNPRDNALLAVMAGCFQDDATPGKLQFGSAWWHLDHRDGMETQLRELAAVGLLGRFVGMLTDSRSFLSYTRHEYFRRILCNLLGREMARGLIPNDLALVGRLVSDVSYHNAARYFGFHVPQHEG